MVDLKKGDGRVEEGTPWDDAAPGSFFSPELPFNVYRQLIETNTENKIAARHFARNGYARSLGCGTNVFKPEGGIDDLHAMDAQDHWPCLAR